MRPCSIDCWFPVARISQSVKSEKMPDLRRTRPNATCIQTAIDKIFTHPIQQNDLIQTTNSGKLYTSEIHEFSSIER